MDLEQTLNELLEDVDMRSEISRRRAYLRCIEYADQKVESEDYNLFLAKAAERLGQVRLMKDILSMNIKTNGKEKVHIRFDDTEGCQIIANPEGCLYLARAFRALSQVKLAGEHLHLEYGEPPMVGETYPAVIYCEDDAYFSAMLDPETPWPDWEIQQREIRPQDIVGFYVGDYFPEELMCTRNHVYAVRAWRSYKEDEEIWKKDIREDSSRMIVLSFQRDDEVIQEIAVDLDDEDIGFVTKEDLLRLMHP